MPRQAVTKEGLRAPLFFVAAALIAEGGVAAQAVSKEDLDRCAKLPTSEMKLACFEALAGDVMQQAPEPAAPPPAAEPATGGGSGLDGPEGQASSVVPADPARAARSGEEPALAAPAPASAAATAAPPAAAADTGGAPQARGAEPVDGAGSTGPEREGDAVLIATVTKVTKGFNDRLSFHCENGQVWRQEARGYIQYPKGRPFEVEISKGMMGDYRLRVGGEGRLTRVVRVR